MIYIKTEFAKRAIEFIDQGYSVDDAIDKVAGHDRTTRFVYHPNNSDDYDKQHAEMKEIILKLIASK